MIGASRVRSNHVIQICYFLSNMECATSLHITLLMGVVKSPHITTSYKKFMKVICTNKYTLEKKLFAAAIFKGL